MPRETEEEMFKRLTSEARAEARREQYRDLERRRQRKIERRLKERLPHAEEEAEEEEAEEEEEEEEEDDEEEAVVRPDMDMVVQPMSIFQASRRSGRRGKGIIMAKPRKRMMMCSAAAGAMTSVGGADVSVDVDVVELDRVEANNNLNGNWGYCSAEEEEEMGDVPPQLPTPPRRDVPPQLPTPPRRDDGTTTDSVAERCLVFAQDEEEEEEEGEGEDREEEKGELATYVEESERRPLPGQVQGEVDQEPETSHATDECATQSLGSLKALGADRGTSWEEAWRQAITEEDEYMA